MLLPLDPDTVAHGIQLSIAPVFLLTAVSGMIGAPEFDTKSRFPRFFAPRP